MLKQGGLQVQVVGGSPGGDTYDEDVCGRNAPMRALLWEEVVIGHTLGKQEGYPGYFTHSRCSGNGIRGAVAGLYRKHLITLQ